MIEDFDEVRRGRRRAYLLTVMDARGTYPNIDFRAPSAMYIARGDMVYSLVEAQAPNEFDLSEIHWNNLSEIRLWGALTLSIREGEGFYRFVPVHSREDELPATLILSTSMREDLAERLVRRIAKKTPAREYDLHRVKPRAQEVQRLYDALGQANEAILRGVNCFMKSLLIWSLPASGLLTEEIGFNLYISLEAGLSTIRRGLSGSLGRSASYNDVFDFIGANFTHGESLAEFWRETHGDRNALLHPDNDFSPYAIQPMSVDDIWELFDPMLTLYRYILLGELRPEFDKHGQVLPRML